MVSQWLMRLSVMAAATFLGACVTLGVVAGCERTERVLDIQTPGADVQVDRNIDTGDVEIDVDDKD
jgi:hypothetical protein